MADTTTRMGMLGKGTSGHADEAQDSLRDGETERLNTPDAGPSLEHDERGGGTLNIAMKDQRPG